jgi:hypothetical protein
MISVPEQFENDTRPDCSRGPIIPPVFSAHAKPVKLKPRYTTIEVWAADTKMLKLAQDAIDFFDGLNGGPK